MNKKLENILLDMVSDLLYYDRKEDEDLPRGEIERMVRDGETSVDEILSVFGDELRKGLSDV